ncbi:molybdenum-binding protein [Haloprofundus marisrubri]|uniref:Molybdenum-binding protein n=1 Tax=Haloprofundus marisrubri TaxID=1514971 RepID=A0A0W1R688_9EURY|nr:TOBE domain-containing protein [Haloprofundus marisrubri]KTG08873.1 molybdenum-binding protein [Haloprofundus marisrubri]
MDGAFEAYLASDGVTFDDGDAALLRAVDDHGSVSGAAAALGRSRARALSRLETLESAFGSLVERRRGGADGGGSELTDGATALLARFARLRAALSGTAGAREAVLFGRLADSDGELAVVDTDAGPVRALVVDADGQIAGSVDAQTPVQVSVRADAVTLHAPDDAPPSAATSARNRFDGVVSDLDSGTAVATVVVDIGANAPLYALVTVESVDRLGLEEGVPVVASFKATATRATVVDE